MATSAINISIPIPCWNGLQQYKEKGPLGYETVVTSGVDIAMSALIKYIATAFGELPKGESSDLLVRDVCDIISELNLRSRQIVIRTDNPKLLEATAKERTMFLVSGMVNASIPIPQVFDGYYTID